MLARIRQLTQLHYDSEACCRTPNAFALISAIFIGVVGRREAQRVRGEAGLKDLRAVLETERESLLEQLVALRVGIRTGTVTQDEHDALSTSLQERLALILHKLSSIDSK